MNTSKSCFYYLGELYLEELVYMGKVTFDFLCRLGQIKAEKL